MKRINSKKLIDDLVNDTQEIIHTVESEFKVLSERELNFRSDGWSVNECIEHLNIADDHYIDLFEKRLASSESIEEGSEFKPGFFGNYFVKSMKPKSDGTIPSKMKTFSKFQPLQSRLSFSMEVFLKDQYKMLDLLDRSRRVDLNKIKVHSAIGKAISFKMGDAFRFVIAHNQRHILQAKNVLNHMRALKQPVL